MRKEKMDWNQMKKLVEYYSRQEEDLDRMYGALSMGYKQRRRLEEIMDALSHLNLDKNNTNILEIGCGDGYGSLFILNGFEYTNYIGLDLSVNKLKNTNKILRKSKVVKADAHFLPFKDEYFNLIFCFETLEHLSDPEKAICEIKRVSKNGGLCIISIPITTSFQKKIRSIFSDGQKQSVFNEHIQSFTKSSIPTLLKKNDFTILHTSYSVFLFPLFHLVFHKYVPYKIWSELDKLLSKLPIGSTGLGTKLDLVCGNKYQIICSKTKRGLI